MKWYRVTLACGPGYVGRPATVHCALHPAMPDRTLVVSLMFGPWLCAMPRRLVHALATEWTEELDSAKLKILEGLTWKT